MLELLNSEGWLAYIGDRKVRTIDEATSYITKILNQTSVQYSVLEKLEAGIPIGILSYMKRESLDFPDFGFALLPEFTQKGYALEASKAFLDNLLTQEPKLKVLAICKENNKPSIKLLKKLGFTYKQSHTFDEEQLKVYELSKENAICLIH